MKGPFRSLMANPLMRALVTIGVLASSLAVPALAQPAQNGWSPPDLLVQTLGDLSMSSMTLVADRANCLHLLFPHRQDESVPFGIDYMHWDGKTWSQPVNILVNRDGSSATNVRAAVDAGQVIHLIWGGGSNALYYASVPAALAGRPQAWSKPKVVGFAITEAAIAVGIDGTIYIAYADTLAVGDVSLTRSNDGGTSWSSPSRVAVTAEGTMPGRIGLALDDLGGIHATWTEHALPDGWPLTGVFYARSLDRGKSWQTPLMVDDGLHGEIGVAAMGGAQVHLVWRSNIGGDGTFHQWSGDGGGSWSPPDAFGDRGGISGMPSFAVDSAGSLHFVIGPAYVASFSGGVLGPYMDVAGEELRTGLGQGDRWTAPERAIIAITSGNRLHVVFETGFQRLWHTTCLVAAPAVAPVALPTVGSTATPASRETTATTSPSLAPTSAPEASHSSPPPTSSKPLPAAAVGVAAASVLTLTVLVWRIARQKR